MDVTDTILAFTSAAGWPHAAALPLVWRFSSLSRGYSPMPVPGGYDLAEVERHLRQSVVDLGLAMAQESPAGECVTLGVSLVPNVDSRRLGRADEDWLVSVCEASDMYQRGDIWVEPFMALGRPWLSALRAGDSIRTFMKWPFRLGARSEMQLQMSPIWELQKIRRDSPTGVPFVLCVATLPCPPPPEVTW